MRRQHEILHRRFRTPFAEVDIVSRDDEGQLHLFEVKGPWREGFPILSRRQFARLSRAATFLGRQYKQACRLHLLSVDDEVSPPKVEVLSDFSLDMR